MDIKSIVIICLMSSSIVKSSQNSSMVLNMFIFIIIFFMKFNNSLYENEELTYEDVFLFQNYFDGKSRLEMDVTPTVSFGTHIPIVTSNMNAVSWKRLAETLARYWGLVVLPQDMDLETLKRIVKFIKNADIHYDTPITVKLIILSEMLLG